MNLKDKLINQRSAEVIDAAIAGSVPPLCSAIEQLKNAKDWILKMAREAEKQNRILDALNLESIVELIEDAESKLRQNAPLERLRGEKQE